MTLAGGVTWLMLALLIGWVGVVLWATYLQVDAEWRRRDLSRPRDRRDRG